MYKKIFKSINHSIPYIVFFFLLFSWIYYIRIQQNKITLNTFAKERIFNIKNTFQNSLSKIFTDTLYLSKIHSSEDIFRGNSAPHHNDFINFCKINEIYTQLRYLDTSGKEIFRINCRNSEPTVIKEADLQDKSDRYYFKELINNEKNHVYVSSFDLNIERGKVEIPYNPTIRFSTPVYDSSDRLIGYVLLNIDGNYILDSLAKINDKSIGEDIMLLNQEGYWLKSNDKEKNWTFMFDDKKDISFANNNPAEWAKILNNYTGQFSTTKGIYTFSTVSTAVSSLKNNVYSYSNSSWKIVSFIPGKPYFSGTLNFLLLIITAFLIICCIVVKRSFRIMLSKEEKKQRVEYIKLQNLAYSRFVPEEFLTILNKKEIIELNLGDSLNRNLGILFSDIRSYTKLSENKTPKEVLNMLNNYFSMINAFIEKNHGIIDKYIGDAVMVLFPNDPVDSLNTAIEIHRIIKSYNKSIEYDAEHQIHSGFGLHFGEITLGTIGTMTRMDMTVIGDSVNLASRLESLTKTYGVDIIISDSLYDLIPDKSLYNIREIDTVRVKGKNVQVIIYEVFDTDDKHILEGKQNSLSTFNQAVSKYKKGEFKEALTLFKKCKEICQEDKLIQVYIRRCNTLVRIPPSDDWSGVTTI